MTRAATTPAADESAPRPAPPPPAASRPAAPAANQWLVPVLVLVVGNFMAVLDITIVNVAVPAIQADFGGSLDDVLWIATAYTLMLGIVVPVSGWLGETLGLTRTYLLSLAAFAVGSALCGIAGNLTSLIVFRILQAIPGGIMPVVAMTLVYRIVPGHRLGAAMGVFGLGTVFAPAVGPVLGGYFVQYLDWRLVFFINVPVGLAGAVAAAVLLPKVAGRRGRKFDLPGFACVALGLFAVLLAASEGSDWGWDSYRVQMLLVGGALLLALFVVIELEVAQPLLDLRVFRVWPFTSSLLMISALTINLLGLSFLVPVFLQQGQHKQAFDAGLLMLPSAVVAGALMPVVGRLYDKVGPRWLGVSGILITSVGTYLLCAITPDTTGAEIILWTSVRGVGLGLSLMPIITAGLSSLPPEQTNQGSALNNVARQTVGALGLAALTALSTSQYAQLFAGRAALMPRPAEPGTGTATAQYGMFQQLSGQVLATSYANLFLLIAVVTGAAAFLALFMRSAPRR